MPEALAFRYPVRARVRRRRCARSGPKNCARCLPSAAAAHRRRLRVLAAGLPSMPSTSRHCSLPPMHRRRRNSTDLRCRSGHEALGAAVPRHHADAPRSAGRAGLDGVVAVWHGSPTRCRLPVGAAGSPPVLALAQTVLDLVLLTGFTQVLLGAHRHVRASADLHRRHHRHRRALFAIAAAPAAFPNDPGQARRRWWPSCIFER